LTLSPPAARLDFHHPACFTALHEPEESSLGEIVTNRIRADVDAPQRAGTNGTFGRNGVFVSENPL